jgi:hypothetical protein
MSEGRSKWSSMRCARTCVWRHAPCAV